MSESKKKWSEEELTDLLDRMQTGSSEAPDLTPDLQDEVEQALNAQKLLAQLEEVQLPRDLPINTARRARRRRRLQSQHESKTWLDVSLSLATLVLIFVMIVIAAQQIQDSKMKQRVEQIDTEK